MGLLDLLRGLIAVVCAALLAYTVTPPVRVLAYKIGAIDVPVDSRRMHRKPIPRLGGLSIFISFTLTSLVFCTPSPALFSIWIGGLLLCVLGTLDDIFRLHWLVKLIVQFLAAGIAVWNGVIIDHISLGGTFIFFGIWSVPLTLIWIVALTNAINFIDGLDGLACGISSICSCSILCVTLISGEFVSALITAILVGACIGFLPFNRNPARIFMGDTGALFLGYTLAVQSVDGVFKLHTLLSFTIPLSIFALPLLDMLFAILRRVLHGKSPFSADRGHLHHRLIDLGFTQKEAVGILYAICGILGLIAVVFTEPMFQEFRFVKAFLLAGVAILVFVINFLIMKNPSARYLSGIFNPDEVPPEQHVSHSENTTDQTMQAAAEFSAEVPVEQPKCDAVPDGTQSHEKSE